MNPFKTTEQSMDVPDFEMILEEARNNGIDWVDAELAEMARRMPDLLRCMTILKAEDVFGKKSSEFTDEEWDEIPSPQLKLVGNTENGLPGVLVLVSLATNRNMMLLKILGSIDAMEEDSDEQNEG